MSHSPQRLSEIADWHAARVAETRRTVEGALRDASVRIVDLERRLAEADAACVDYERQRDDAIRREVSALTRMQAALSELAECQSNAASRKGESDGTDEQRHAVVALSEQNDRLRFERDIARQEFCRAMADMDDDKAQGIAEDLGWDCFRENTNGK